MWVSSETYVCVHMVREWGGGDAQRESERGREGERGGKRGREGGSCLLIGKDR